MKKILLWDPRQPSADPVRLEIDDTVASACVRAGVAAAADPADAGALAAGGSLSGESPTEIILWSTVLKIARRVVVPLAVATIAVQVGAAVIPGGFPLPAGAADQDRYMFWASGAKVPSGALVTAASGTEYVMTKLVFGSPQYAINHLRLHFSGFASTEGGSSPQETVLPGNATAIDGVWIEAGGVLTRCKFAGEDGVSVASAANGNWTDDVALAVPIAAESLVTIYTLYHCAVGEKQIPAYQIEKGRGERVWGGGGRGNLAGADWHQHG